MTRARLFLGFAGAFLLVAPFAPPLFALAADASWHRAAWWEVAARLTDAPWRFFCHRLPGRVMFVFGEPMPICSRCEGIFAGLGAGFLVGRPALPPRRLLFVVAVAALAMLVEIGTQEAGWHPVFHPSRLLSGLLLAYPIGATAAALARKASFSAENSENRPTR